jgi:hypothetical protein
MYQQNAHSHPPPKHKHTMNVTLAIKQTLNLLLKMQTTEVNLEVQEQHISVALEYSFFCK